MLSTWTRTIAVAVTEHHLHPMLERPVVAILVKKCAMRTLVHRGPLVEVKTSNSASRSTTASTLTSRGVKAVASRAASLSIRSSGTSTLRQARASATAISTFMTWKYTTRTKANIPLPIIFIIFDLDLNFQIISPTNLAAKQVQVLLLCQTMPAIRSTIPGNELWKRHLTICISSKWCRQHIYHSVGMAVAFRAAAEVAVYMAMTAEVSRLINIRSRVTSEIYWAELMRRKGIKSDYTRVVEFQVSFSPT